MRTGTIRLMLTLAAFVLVIQWSRSARADVTIQGTVGEIGIKQFAGRLSVNGAYQQWPYIRFKFTDPNQTSTCTDQLVDANNQPIATLTAKYAWFSNQSVANQGSADANAKEWYTALLVSKKGATIICTVSDANNCHITGCTLP